MFPEEPKRFTEPPPERSQRPVGNRWLPQGFALVRSQRLAALMREGRSYRQAVEELGEDGR